MRMLVRNLSLSRTPCERVATMVVSEMNERLSPKNAPPTTAPTTKGRARPEDEATPVVTGTKAITVPTLVPMLSETKQAARNNPGTNSETGSARSVMATVESMAPICLAEAANAPARMKIQSIIIKFFSPAPRLNTLTRSAMGSRPRWSSDSAGRVASGWLVMKRA